MPKLIQIGKRILNLDAVRYMEVEGPKLVNVYLTGGAALKFIGAEAEALMRLLEEDVIRDEAQVSAESARKSTS